MVKIACPHCKHTFSNYKQLENHMELRHPESFEIINARSMEKRSRKTELFKKKIIIVDGNNVAYQSTNKPTIINLIKVESFLRKKGYKPIIVISAKLKYIIDNPRRLMKLVREGTIVEVGTGDNDDIEIFELAIEHDATILSNDRFLEYRDQYPEIDTKLKKIVITDSRIIIK